MTAAGPVPGLDGMASAYAARRYAVLFYTILATLGLTPLLTALGLSANLLQILLAFTLLIAVLDVPGQRWRRALIALAAVVIALRVVPASAIGTQIPVTALIVGTGVALLAAASAMRFALSGRIVAAEHVYAALSAYLLAGQFFGVLFWAIAAAWPGSFAESGAAGEPAGLALSTAIYFSFVTLATLGYGDVVPKTDLARGLAVLEAVGGQLFIAVTIARLVSANAHGSAGDPERSSRSSSRTPRGGAEASEARDQSSQSSSRSLRGR